MNYRTEHSSSGRIISVLPMFLYQKNYETHSKTNYTCSPNLVTDELFVSDIKTAILVHFAHWGQFLVKFCWPLKWKLKKKKIKLKKHHTSLSLITISLLDMTIYSPGLSVFCLRIFFFFTRILVPALSCLAGTQWQVLAASKQFVFKYIMKNNKLLLLLSRFIVQGSSVSFSRIKRLVVLIVCLQFITRSLRTSADGG